MNYRIFIQEDPEGTSKITEIAQVTCEVPNPSLAQRIETEIFQTVTRVVNSLTMPEGAPLSVTQNLGKGRPARSLYILHFADPGHAPSTLRVGEIVSSSMELSTLLGYNYNMVLQGFAHARAKRKKDLAAAAPEDRELLAAGRLEVTLRGVTFCYTDALASKTD